MSIGRTYGIPTVALRYFNVYGPRQSLSNPYTGVAAIFTSRIKNKNPPFIFEDGLQSRDFIHVEDVASANIMAMESKNANFECINIGTQSVITIKGLAELLSSRLNSNIKPIISNEGRPGDVRHCFADITKLRRLGFKHRYPHLDINTLVDWSNGIAAVDQFEIAKKELDVKFKK